MNVFDKLRLLLTNPDVKMHPVESEAVREIGYDRRRQALRVRFKGGSLYEYGCVNRKTFRHLKRADSHGRFMHKEVIGQYPYQKLEAPKKKPLADEKSPERELVTA